MHRQVGLWRFQTDYLKRKSLLKRVFLESSARVYGLSLERKALVCGTSVTKNHGIPHIVSTLTSFRPQPPEQTDRQTAEGELRFHFCSRAFCAALMPFRFETDKSHQYSVRKANYCVGWIFAFLPSQFYKPRA